MTNTVTALLTEILTPDLYRRNPFRVLGLPVTASIRAIATHVQKHQILVELGSTDKALEGPFPVKPAPTLEDIRKAERELHDPIRRIIHELFWFWPLDGVDGAKDPGYLALKAGDVATARRIWRDAGANPVTAPIALHNNAVRCHLAALGLEKKSRKLLEDPQAEERCMRYWKAAIGLWDEVLGNDVTWAALSARGLLLGDDRLSMEFIQEIRASIAEAFVAINAGLLAKYVGQGRDDLADFHVSLICEGTLKSFSAINFANNAVARLKGGLRSFLRANDPGIEGREASGADIASTLIEMLSHYNACFETLDLHATDVSWRATVDDVIRKANLYAVAYVEKTKDNARFVAVLRSTIVYINADDLFTLVDGNARSAVRIIATAAAAHLAPYFELLAQTNKSNDTPKIRLNTIDQKVISHLDDVRRTLAAIGHPINEFVNAIVVVLRGISVDAWNNKRDVDTASKALDFAEQIVVDKDLAKEIKTDRSMLKERQAAAEGAKRQHRKSLMWAALPIILVIGLTIYGVNRNQDEGGTTTPMPSPKTTQPVAADQESASATGTEQAPPQVLALPPRSTGSSGTYSVPQRYEAELKQDSQETDWARAEARTLYTQVEAAQGRVQTARAEVDTLKAQADLLSDSIEAQRPLLSTDDRAAEVEFNAQVGKYNQLIVRLRRLNSLANQDVQAYNDLVEEARGQNEALNRLVEAYNAKLARYGTPR